MYSTVFSVNSKNTLSLQGDDSSTQGEDVPSVSRVCYDPALDKGCYFNDGKRKIGEFMELSHHPT